MEFTKPIELMQTKGNIFFPKRENHVDVDVKLCKNSDGRIQNFVDEDGFGLPYKLTSQVEL